MEFYCSECGGLWKLDYKPPKFNISEIDRDEWSMFRYRKSGSGPPLLVNPAPARIALNAPFQLPVRTLQKNRRPNQGLLLFCLECRLLIQSPQGGDILHLKCLEC